MSIISKLSKIEELEKYLNDNKQRLVILYFSANWSDECKLIKSNIFDELSKEEKYKDYLAVLEIEAEEFEDISMKYGIESVPSFVFVKNNHTIHQSSGADATQLRKKINDLSVLVSHGDSGTAKPIDLETRLKKLISSSPVMAFIKGTRDEPRCGFTRQLIEILKNKNIKYGTFDILSDNEVREGLKKYSNWPTYPQVYINSELIGGLDIIKELVENGELDPLIPKEDESLKKKLESLINLSKIVLFMKGTVKEPKCGFSRQAIEILNGSNAKYETFDIISDEEVRQGLKEYSKWPTYPQLYVNGQLVGGLDIMKELKENGELNAALNGDN